MAAVAEAKALAGRPSTGGGVGGQGSGGNLSYLRHVVAAYMEMDDGQVEQDALFQVIATFLQFDAPTVQRLHLARRRKADAAGGLFGKWM